MIKITKEKILDVCSTSCSLAQAASVLGIDYRTLRRLAKLYGCFVPKQSGKGTRKNRPKVYSTADILQGKYPQFQTFKLKRRLYAEGIKVHRCEQCGITLWLGKFIPLELEHIDGNKHNHKLENLKILCPNCHSQTITYRAKNKSLKREIAKEKLSNSGKSLK